MPNCKTLSLNTVGGAQALAERIEGFHADDHDHILFAHGDLRTDPIRGNQDFTEFRLQDRETGEWASAAVTIERPRVAYGDNLLPATVTFSSSSSSTVGADYAVATAALLTFAADAANLLTTWAQAGQLPRLGGAVVQPGVWSYAFPDAVENGRSKTITYTSPEPLEHSEIEERLHRYGATSCEITPPAVAS